MVKLVRKENQIISGNSSHTVNEQADPSKMGRKLQAILDSKATVDMEVLFEALDEDIEEFYKDLYGESI